MDDPTAPADPPASTSTAPTVIYRHRLATRIWHFDDQHQLEDFKANYEEFQKVSSAA